MVDCVEFYRCDPGGCGILRIVQPAKYLKNLGYKINSTILNTAKSIDSNVKICVFQRDYVQPDVIQYWEWLKDRGIKIVYDIDDDIFDIPKSNPNYSWFKRIDVRSRYEYYIRNADLVTVSTNYLKTRLENLNQNIIVLPNCIDFETWPSPVNSTHPQIRIGWAGSPTHHEDLMAVFPAIKNIMKRYKNIQLYFLGFCPQEYLDEFKNRLTFIEGGDYTVYQLKLAQLGLDIGFMPLVVNGLNKSKSPVKYLEYSSLKIPSVASYDSPYRDVIKDGDNGYLANSLKEWEEKLEILIKNKSLRRKVADRAYDYCSQKFDISKQISRWENAYKRLLNGALEKEVLETAAGFIQAGDTTYSNEYQLLADQFNFAKLFVNNKEILITNVRNPFGFEILQKAGVKRIYAVDSDQEVLNHVSKRNQGNRILSFQYCNFDHNQNPAIKGNFDLILSINDYSIIVDKRKFLLRLQNLLKKFGILIISFYTADEAERRQFLSLVQYFFKVTNTVLLQEYTKIDDPKYLVVFATKY